MMLSDGEIGHQYHPIVYFQSYYWENKLKAIKLLQLVTGVFLMCSRSWEPWFCIRAAWWLTGPAWTELRPLGRAILSMLYRVVACNCCQTCTKSTYFFDTWCSLQCNSKSKEKSTSKPEPRKQLQNLWICTLSSHAKLWVIWAYLLHAYEILYRHCTFEAGSFYVELK